MCIRDSFKPLAKTAKAGGKAGAKAIYKTTNLLLRGATLILTGAIIAVLAFHFWQNYKPYGTLAQAIDQHNYVLGAYFAVALFLLLIECITFLTILFGSKTKKDRKGRAADNGRGLFSFLFIYAGSYLDVYKRQIGSISILSRFLPLTSTIGRISRLAWFSRFAWFSSLFEDCVN